jgi:hypothetical protein
MRRITLLLFLIVFSFCAYQLRLHSRALLYFGDEYDYVARGVFLDIALRGDFHSPLWNVYDSYVQEKVPSYYYQSVLHILRVASPPVLSLVPAWGVNSWCKEYEYSKDNCLTFLDYWIWKDEYFINFDGLSVPQDAFASLPQHLQSKMLPVMYARWGALFIACLSLVVFFLTLLRTYGRLAGLLGIIAISFHGLFRDSTLRSMGDGPLVLFLLLTLYFSVEWFRSTAQKSSKGSVALFILIGICIGLAMSSKLVGVLGFACVAGVLFQSATLTKRQIIERTIVLIILTFAVFVLMHPFVWENPVYKIYFMFRHRAVETLAYMQIMPAQALPTFGQRLNVLLSQVGNSTGAYIFPAPWGSILDIALFVLGTGILMYDARFGKHMRQVWSRLFLFWGASMLIGMSFYLGLSWARYYLPFAL